MFRSFLPLLAIALALPVAASAQTSQQAPPAPPAAGAPPALGAMPRHHHNRWMSALRTLALSPDQKQQIRGLVRDARTANQGADAPTKRANAKKLRSDIEAILTPDQRTQLRTALEQQRTNPPAQ